MGGSQELAAHLTPLAGDGSGLARARGRRAASAALPGSPFPKAPKEDGWPWNGDFAGDVGCRAAWWGWMRQEGVGGGRWGQR